MVWAWILGARRKIPTLGTVGPTKVFEGVSVAYQRSGDGAVVMTKAQGGLLLAYQVVRSIATLSGWPDFRPILREKVKVDPAVLSTYTGVYELTATFSITITLENGQLMESNRPGSANSRSFPNLRASSSGRWKTHSWSS
jgi:hypothetical protein